MAFRMKAESSTTTTVTTSGTPFRQQAQNTSPGKDNEAESVGESYHAFRINHSELGQENDVKEIRTKDNSEFTQLFPLRTAWNLGIGIGSALVIQPPERAVLPPSKRTQLRNPL
ncbi:hypothetical protein GGQ74_003128 [Desulfobaculum xiamenense]|uniref:Uncharacterized protein n=1 Tax=Desulfobaculum xiamenense TaxID=995050 RepID=A0A846QKG7_9BACT|nr:hypothetical protein [Desulfobaculum xiamenense]NJB69426.1 hypothetical protein [Desulfobaculum xiamenense]